MYNLTFTNGQLIPILQYATIAFTTPVPFDQNMTSDSNRAQLIANFTNNLALNFFNQTAIN